MNRWAPHLYLREGQNNDIPITVIEESLRQANHLQDRGFPPVLTLGHLSYHTDIKYTRLRRIVARQTEAYRTFSIRKRTGGKRYINVPELDLLKVQKWIDRFILSKIKESPFSYAFKSGTSIVDCANQHIACKWLVKIDLRHFFESLSEIQVYRVFLEEGYNNLVSFELARLCTKVLSHGAKKYRKSNWQNNKSFLFNWKYYDKRIGHLPQGAPTSPRLANLIVRELDIEISRIVKQYSMTYTRYADDLIFSTGSTTFSRKNGQGLIREIYSILPRYGLRPHPQKAQIIPPGARKIVLGLLVDGDKARLTKHFRSNLECHLYYCVKDPISHLKNRKFASILGLKNYINGLLAYAKQVDSDYVKKITSEIGKLKWPI